MALDTYANLQTAVGSFLNRTDLATSIPDFITLAEADMQRRCKLVEFEATSTVTITAGVGTIPTGFVGSRSAYWNGDTDYPVRYITPNEFDEYRQDTDGDGLLFTVSGTTLRTAPAGSGSLVLTYRAQFAPLSSSATSNSLLANHPDVYLYGALRQAAIFLKDTGGISTYGGMMDAAVAGVKVNDDERKYPGPLRVVAK